jgi:protein-disulfide isomerase
MNIRLAVAVLSVSLGLFAQPKVQNGKARGVATAPIQMEVFSDYQCAACKEFFEQTLRPLIADYVNTGKVYLVHRDFPLPMHAYAREAAAYAVAAAHSGKYHEVSEALFSKQDDWSRTGRPGMAALSVLSATEAQKVKALASTPGIKAEIDKDVERARDAKINQTPTMILTHKKERYPVAGMVSYPILRRFLDQLLAK